MTQNPDPIDEFNRQWLAKYHGQILAKARQFCGWWDPEDLLADTYLIAREKIKRYDASKWNLGMCINRACHHGFIDAIRLPKYLGQFRNSVRKRVYSESDIIQDEQDETPVGVAHTGADFIEEIITREVIDKLRAKVLKLQVWPKLHLSLLGFLAEAEGRKVPGLPDPASRRKVWAYRTYARRLLYIFLEEIDGMKNAPALHRHRIPSQTDYRSRQFAILFSEGVTPTEIAHRWGCEPHTVITTLCKMGFTISKPRKSRKPRKPRTTKKKEK